jgi:hypothetical protein
MVRGTPLHGSPPFAWGGPLCIGGTALHGGDHLFTTPLHGGDHPFSWGDPWGYPFARGNTRLAWHPAPRRGRVDASPLHPISPIFFFIFHSLSLYFTLIFARFFFFSLFLVLSLTLLDSLSTLSRHSLLDSSWRGDTGGDTRATLGATRGRHFSAPQAYAQWKISARGRHSGRR